MPSAGCLWCRPLAATGASPSGKAADFGSAIRRFESSRPSHLRAAEDMRELTREINRAEAFPWDRAPRHLIRDRDSRYGGATNCRRTSRPSSRIHGYNGAPAWVMPAKSYCQLLWNPVMTICVSSSPAAALACTVTALFGLDSRLSSLTQVSSPPGRDRCRRADVLHRDLVGAVVPDDGPRHSGIVTGATGSSGSACPPTPL